MRIKIWTLLSIEWSVYMLNWWFCSKYMIDIYISWIRFVKHILINNVLDFLSISMMIAIAQKLYCFVTPGDILVVLKHISDVFVLRLLNDTSLNSANFGTYDKIVAFKDIISFYGNKHNCSSSQNTHLIVLLSCQYMSFAWMTKILFWILPIQNFSIHWDSYQVV